MRRLQRCTQRPDPAGTKAGTTVPAQRRASPRLERRRSEALQLRVPRRKRAATPPPPRNAPRGLPQGDWLASLQEDHDEEAEVVGFPVVLGQLKLRIVIPSASQYGFDLMVAAQRPNVAPGASGKRCQPARRGWRPQPTRLDDTAYAEQRMAPRSRPRRLGPRGARRELGSRKAAEIGRIARVGASSTSCSARAVGTSGERRRADQ